MAKIKRALDSTVIFWLMCAWLTFFVFANLWPASAWLDVERVSVSPALAGQPVPMLATRNIKRDFVGSWRVTVRRWEPQGWVVYCNAGGSNNYSAQAVLPAKLTLDWWTNGQCPLLTEGRYTITTSWQIQPSLPFIPDKTVQIESNIFEVAR